jgi:DNA (cytosine-5)-methyltransferase 1
LRFVDLFAGLGGFHVALRSLGHECVFACEVDPELQTLYRENFSEAQGMVHGDIRQCKAKVPPHDVLCAGFPCQPFSKSGFQRGLGDRTRGTLFHEILEILRRQRPEYVILENVGNFERHDGGRTWRIVKESLETLDYDVRGTEHIATGGHGLMSPHHLGFPHTRERFFIVASRGGLPPNPFPPIDRAREANLKALVQPRHTLSQLDVEETRLTARQETCIAHWNRMLRSIPPGMPLPSFPIWGDELEASYPFKGSTPYSCPLPVLRQSLSRHGATQSAGRRELLSLLPGYAQTPVDRFPAWKARFIEQNREWLTEIHRHMPSGWAAALRKFPPSLRKLEWNCQGEKRDLWRYVLQFRPSGLRAKRYTSCPALVAMTTTQIPILGPERRFLTRTEGLLLQGFPKSHLLPRSRARAFAALGNAVHVGVVAAVARRLVS